MTNTSTPASNRVKDLIRECRGIVHGDGNIFFTNERDFLEAAARATLPAPIATVDADMVDAQLAIDNVLCSVLPGVYYMDPPDGGSVTPLEQVQRMAKDAARYRRLKPTYTAANFDPASLELGAKGVVLMFVAPDDTLVSSDLDEMIDDAVFDRAMEVEP